VIDRALVVGVVTLLGVGWKILIALRQDRFMRRVEDLSIAHTEDNGERVIFWPEEALESEKRGGYPVPLEITNRGRSVGGVTVQMYLEEFEGYPIYLNSESTGPPQRRVRQPHQRVGDRGLRADPVRCTSDADRHAEAK
jgi:hypothetical protein